MKRKIKEYFQHRFNVLHVYSRLCPIVGRQKAKVLCIKWEHTFIHKKLYA